MSLKSLQVEKHVISGIIQNPKVFPDIERFINENDFTEEAHRVIFSCIKSFIQKNQPLDTVLLSQEIHNLGISFKDELNIFDYLESICFTSITEQATIQAAKELVKLRVLRDINSTCEEIKNYTKNNISQDIVKTITEIDSIYSKNVNSISNQEEEPQDIFDDLFETVERLGNEPKEAGLLTPYPKFNKYFGPFRGGNIYAVASRTGQGKSTWLTDCANETGKLNKVPVLYLDTELTKEEAQLRIAAAKSGVPLHYVETGKWRFNNEFVKKIREKLPNVKKEYRMYHLYVGNKEIDEIVSIIRRWILKVVGRDKSCIVVYDYLKLTGEKLSNHWVEYQALGEKVDKLKRICIEYNFPLLTAIQINRSGENTNRKSSEVIDDASVISISDRVSWFVTLLAILRRRTADEITLDTPESGTHKFIPLKLRYQGEAAAGHNDFILRKLPDGNVKYVRNFINFNLDNFHVEEKGSLEDSIQRQNSVFRIHDNHNNDNKIL